MTTVISLAKDILAAETGAPPNAVATQTASTNDAMRTVNVPRANAATPRKTDAENVQLLCLRG